jgi:hypothetical protein
MTPAKKKDSTVGKTLLTISEAAKLLGVPETTVIDELCIGRLEAVALARAVSPDGPAGSGFWTIGRTEIIDILHDGSATFSGFQGNDPVEIVYAGGLSCVRLEAESLNAFNSAGLPTPRDDSLLKVIAALLAHFPKRKAPSARDLEKSAASVGIEISDSTIQSILRRVREIAPDL